jgi:predicted AAA+ superfamily ATPase
MKDLKISGLCFIRGFNVHFWSTLQMFRFITETFQRLIDELPPMQTRYLYPQFQLRNRLTGLVGPRGVGKTTLLLQYIKNELLKDKHGFYFSADLVYFQQANLLQFVSDLHQKEGYTRKYLVLLKKRFLRTSLTITISKLRISSISKEY